MTRGGAFRAVVGIAISAIVARNPSMIAVSVKLGQTALMRTPALAHDGASDRTNAVTADLDAAYSGSTGTAANAAMLAVTMTSPPRSRIAGHTACRPSTGPSRFAPISRR